MINESFARSTGFSVGSKFELAVIETDDNGLPLVKAMPAERFAVKVVGVMVLNEEITSESIDTTPRLFVSPAARIRPIGDSRYYGPFDKAKVARVLDRSPDVAAWRYVGTGRSVLTQRSGRASMSTGLSGPARFRQLRPVVDGSRFSSLVCSPWSPRSRLCCPGSGGAEASFGTGDLPSTRLSS